MIRIEENELSSPVSIRALYSLIKKRSVYCENSENKSLIIAENKGQKKFSEIVRTVWFCAFAYFSMTENSHIKNRKR